MQAFLTSMLLVGIGELGDKTQFLTFNFALKYPKNVVISAVIAATLVLQLIAVGLGGIIGNLLDPMYLKIIAGVLFISFGIWEFIPESKNEKKKEIFKLSPFFLVFFSFLVAEMGDKTQLSAAALAMDYKEFFMVWAGASTGMIITNLLAIWIAGIFNNKMAKTYFKYLAAVLFLTFGVYTLIAAFAMNPVIIMVPK